MAWNDEFPPLNLWNYNNMIKTPEWPAVPGPLVSAKNEVQLKEWAISRDINAIQYGGKHYKDKAIQPWDYVIANNLGYLEGSIIKYVSRYQDKNGLEDLHKARHFLDKLIEVKQREGQ